jgi:hypothetical protein
MPPSSWPAEAPVGEWGAVAIAEPPSPPPVPAGPPPAEVALPAPPAAVWVAVVTVVTEILVRAPMVNTGAKSIGMGGLFGRANDPAVMQEHSAARVCGVAATEDEARSLLDLWKARNGQVVVGDEMVLLVPFGIEADVGLDMPEARQCADCGTVISFGNRCRSCTEQWNAQLRAKDGAILEDALREADNLRQRAERRGAYDQWKSRAG